MIVTTREIALKYRQYWAKQVKPRDGKVSPVAPSAAKRHIGNIRSLYADYFKHVGEEERPNPFCNMHFKAKARTCPDCGGALRQSQLGTLKQFRCHIGHICTAEVMLHGQFIAMQQSVEAALPSLNERAQLCRQMAEQAGRDTASAAEWRQAGDEARDQTDRLRALLDHVWIQPATTVTAGP